MPQPPKLPSTHKLIQGWVTWSTIHVSRDKWQHILLFRISKVGLKHVYFHVYKEKYHISIEMTPKVDKIQEGERDRIYILIVVQMDPYVGQNDIPNPLSFWYAPSISVSLLYHWQPWGTTTLFDFIC